MTVAIVHADSAMTGQSLFVQFDDAGNTRIQMVEGTTPREGIFEITVAEVISAGVAEGLYHPVVKVGVFDDPQENEEIRGIVEFDWNGSTEDAVRLTTIGDLIDEANSGIADEVIAGVSEAIPDQFTISPGNPLAMGVEPVPASRTLVMVDSPDGLRSEVIQNITVTGSSTTHAVDFRNRLSNNQSLYTIDSIEFIEGDESGLEIDAVEDWEIDGGSQARFELRAIAAGDYRARINVTYINPGTTDVGDLRIRAHS